MAAGQSEEPPTLSQFNLGRLLPPKKKRPLQIELLMTPAEGELYRKTIRGRARVVEFGVGGSTKAAMEEGVQHLLSIETDPVWSKTALTTPGIREGVEAGRIEVRHVDVGPVAKMGRPQDPSRREDWPDFSTAPWAAYKDSPPDMVLIDGRFRVACTLQAVLNCPPSTTIVIHDFWDRPHYHVVLKYLDWHASADRMGVFTPRVGIDRAEVQATYEQYKYDYE